MKISFLVLATVLAVANAGVGVLGPREAEEAMRLFFQHCGGNSEGGSDGNTHVYCKKAREPEILRDAQHELVVTPAPEAARQVVFVQPPDYLYRHNIQIKGGSGQSQQTKIYVLPPKINHQVAYDDVRQAGPSPNKPQLFFLNDQPGAPGSGGGHGGNRPSPYDPRGFGNDQFQQPQQLSQTTLNCAQGNPNCANSGQTSNDGGFAAAPHVQPSFGSPQVQPPVSASTNEQPGPNHSSIFRPVRQYLPRLNPLSQRSVRG